MLRKFTVTVLAFTALSASALAQAPVRAANQAAVAARKAANGKKQKKQPLPPIEKLRAMSPADRQKALKNMPADRREKFEQRLAQYDSMSAGQRKSVERFQKLPPTQQAEVRKVYKRFNQIPAERQQTLRKEMRHIAPMNVDERKKYFESDQFRGKYNDDEQRMLHQLADSFPNQ